jgi:hypothetical protein
MNLNYTALYFLVKGFVSFLMHICEDHVVMIKMIKIIKTIKMIKIKIYFK